jgi:hypothetical protein
VRGEVLARSVACLQGETRAVVDVRVDEVVQTSDYAISLDGGTGSGDWPRAGEVLHGVLGNAYAYTHEFVTGEAVAVLVQGPEQPLPWLELMPLDGEDISVHWAGVQYTASFEDLTREDCDAREHARRNGLPHESLRRPSGETPTAPVATCTP